MDSPNLMVVNSWEGFIYQSMVFSLHTPIWISEVSRASKYPPDLIDVANYFLLSGLQVLIRSGHFYSKLVKYNL